MSSGTNLAMVIVTAADSRYFIGLANLVGSVHYWSSATEIVIYDLGLDHRQLDEVGRWRNVRQVGGFLDREIPDHCRKLRLYAWKPLVIEDAIRQHESVLWVDAGSDLRAPPWGRRCGNTNSPWPSRIRGP